MCCQKGPNHGSKANGAHPVDVLHACGPALQCLQGVAVEALTGNELVGRLGSAFRKWCRDLKKIEIPPCVWSLHMIGRGEHDKRNYPELDSNIKAAHTKPILFFLCDLAIGLSQACPCISGLIVIQILVFKQSFHSTCQGPWG